MSVRDRYASAAITDPTPESRAWFLELTEGGKKALVLAHGEERRYVQEETRLRCGAGLKGAPSAAATVLDLVR